MILPQEFFMKMKSLKTRKVKKSAITTVRHKDGGVTIMTGTHYTPANGDKVVIKARRRPNG